MKSWLFLLCGCVAAAAAPVEVNGTFERVTPNQNGVAMPEGWVFNTAVSKKATARLSRESGTFRSGNFGLLVETEPGGRLFMQCPKHIPAKTGDTLELTIHARGDGDFSLGFIVYGQPESGGKSRFIRTITGKPHRLKNVEKWTKYSSAVPVARQEQKGIVYTRYTLLPVLTTGENAELCFDDLTVELKSPEGRR